MTKRLAPIHPGEILLEEFLVPMGISQYRLAKDVRVPPRRINEIVHGTRAVSADTALRLARYFGTPERFWLNLQAQYDLDVEYDRIGDRIERRSDLSPADPPDDRRLALPGCVWSLQARITLNRAGLG